MSKLKMLFRKIMARLEYADCYSYQEFAGNAIFGNCGGCNDLKCPYNYKRSDDNNEPLR